MPMADFSRATSFRIAIFCALASVALLLAVMAVIRFGAATIWGDDLEEAVILEQQRLLVVHERSGTLGLRALIETMAKPVGNKGFLYLLQDRQGVRLAGLIEPMPARDGWTRFVPPWVEEDESFTAIGRNLPDGNFLLVAHDAHDLPELIDLVTEGTVWILTLILPLSMVSSLAISALILRKLDAINQVAEEIRGGNIHQRIPTTGTGDEFDRLAGHLNGMLDSIEDLTEGLRQVSNEIAHQMRTPLAFGASRATRRDQLSKAHRTQ
jgi:methyl-accepting chemotaxis protein